MADALKIQRTLNIIGTVGGEYILGSNIFPRIQLLTAFIFSCLLFLTYATSFWPPMRI
jgi:hypothetical protein